MSVFAWLSGEAVLPCKLCGTGEGTFLSVGLMRLLTVQLQVYCVMTPIGPHSGQTTPE